MRKPLSIDGDMARRLLDLLGPDHHHSYDDNQARARARLKTGKPRWADHRHGSIDDQLKWLNEQQAQGWASSPPSSA
jgi:hypothetical protein